MIASPNRQQIPPLRCAPAGMTIFGVTSRGELDAIPEAETVAGGRMVYEARRCGTVVEVSALDAGRKAENGCSQGFDVAVEPAVIGVEVTVCAEFVALLRHLPVEEVLERDVGNGVVEVDEAVDAFCLVGQDAIAKGSVTEAGAAEGVERYVWVGEAAEGEDGESGAEAVAGKTDFRLGMLVAIVCDQGVDLFPDLIEGELKAAVDQAWLGEQVSDKGEVAQRRSRILRDGAIVGFVHEHDVEVRYEIGGVVPFCAAKGA
jgi:hypothetical protein